MKNDLKRSLLGIHFDIPKTNEVKNEIKKEVGHSIDPENLESNLY